MPVNAVVQSNPITGEILYAIAVSHDNKQLASIILKKAPGILEAQDNQSIAAPSYRSQDSNTSQATMKVIEDLSEVDLLKLLASKYKGNIKDALHAITIAAEDYIDDEDEKEK